MIYLNSDCLLEADEPGTVPYRTSPLVTMREAAVEVQRLLNRGRVDSCGRLITGGECGSSMISARAPIGATRLGVCRLTCFRR